MKRIALTVNDVREMLSSMILAELPYDQRLQWIEGASLPADFALTRTALPDLAVMADRADRMFHTKTSDSLEGMPLGRWAKAVARSWNSRPEQLTFFTSGSTGTPVPATHAFALHVQEVLALAELFRDRSRIVGFVPRHHIYGFLFSILLPKALGIDVIWRQPMPTPGLVDDLHSGDLVIAFPLFWEKLVRLGTRFPGNVYGVTSTGPCPADVIHSLRSNGLERMTEMYGASETGGVGFRHAPDDAYTLLPHWRKTDAPDTLKRTHADGTDREYVMQDRLDWTGARTFRPAGRADKAVQVAGINVYPNRVQDIILTHPQVRQCAVRLMRSEEGSRLKALVVLHTEAAPETVGKELRALAQKRLTPYERPESWTFADALPTSPMGKITDW